MTDNTCARRNSRQRGGTASPAERDRRGSTLSLYRFVLMRFLMNLRARSGPAYDGVLHSIVRHAEFKRTGIIRSRLRARSDARRLCEFHLNPQFNLGEHRVETRLAR